jgi:hypothetical protein
MIYLLVFILMSFVANTNAQCPKDQDCYEVWSPKNNLGKLALDTCNGDDNIFRSYAHDWKTWFKFNVFNFESDNGDTLRIDDINPEYYDLIKFFNNIEEEFGEFFFISRGSEYDAYFLKFECYARLFDNDFFKYLNGFAHRYEVPVSVQEYNITGMKVIGSKVIYDPLGIKEIYLVNILGEKIEINNRIGEIDFTEFNDGIYFLRINSNTFKLIKTGGSNAKIYRSIH